MTKRLPEPHDHHHRMAAARRRARYEIGDSSWADVIVAAYRDPDASDLAIREEEEL